ncbi:MAG: hypothetical protein ACK4Z9_02020 [Thermodesulfovibrionales bacterium]
MNFLKLCFTKTSQNRSSYLWGCIQLLFYAAIIFQLSSCATKRIEIQYYEGSLYERLRSFEEIRSIKATFSIEFDRGDGVVIKGDGILNLSEDALDLQVYSMGFLVAEVNADNSGVKSNPSVNKNRLIMLVDGLRNSFFWWDIKGYDLKDEEDHYIVRNSWKRLTINKKTMMPLNQVIDLEDGKHLDVSYYEPSDINGFPFPSRIRIELSNYAVDLRIKDVTLP